jgi:hypothetical protein
MSEQFSLPLGTGAQMVANQAASYDDLAMAGWDPQSGSADSDLLPELETLQARSRDLSRNNGLMAGGMQTLKDNIVGAVLRLVANPDYRLLGWDVTEAREWGNNTEAKFRSWAETDGLRRGPHAESVGLTIQALGGSMMNGDALALPMWLPRPDSQVVDAPHDHRGRPFGHARRTARARTTSARASSSTTSARRRRTTS